MQKDKKELQFSMEDLYNFHLFQDKEPKENNDDDIDDNTFQFSPVTHSRFAETSNEQNDSMTSSPLSFAIPRNTFALEIIATLLFAH